MRNKEHPNRAPYIAIEGSPHGVLKLPLPTILVGRKTSKMLEIILDSCDNPIIVDANQKGSTFSVGKYRNGFSDFMAKLSAFCRSFLASLPI